MMIPQTHIERMKEEHTALEEKITKLDAFLKTEVFKLLQDWQRTLLIAQRGAMGTYHFFLGERIINDSLDTPK